MGDVFTHLYTLIVNTDGTYEVLIDNESAQKGSLTDDWDFLPPKMIKDPEVSKPDDWVDAAKIDDPEDVKPEDWEKPEHIADPDATKPEDWDDEMDGEWEPPMIDNPEYNADDAKELGKFDEVCKIGFDLWQVKSGTIFDNILITDDVDEAKKIGDETWGVTKDAEKKMKDEQDEAEKAKAESEAKEAEPEEEEEDDDEDLDEIDDEKEEEAHDEL